METSAQATPLPTSRKVLCVVYGAVATVGLITTWSPLVAYLPDRFMNDFMDDLRSTPASRSYTADLLLLALTAVTFMVTEARRRGIRFVWLYVIGGFVTAMAVTFPLFLIARELRMGNAEPPSLRASDAIMLTVMAVLIATHVIWVLMR